MTINLREFRVPAFCPNCERVMKGKSTSTYYDWGCCIECYIYFLEGRDNWKEKWKDGWRPTPEQIKQMNEAFRD